MFIVYYLEQEKLLRLLESFHDIHNTFPQVFSFTNCALQAYVFSSFV